MSNDNNIVSRFWRSKPLSIFRAFQHVPYPTARELAEMLLNECRRDMLQEAELWESHAATYRMLKEREFRLARELHRLSQPQVLVPPPTKADECSP